MNANATLERALEIAEELIAFDTESSKSNLALIDRVEFYLKRFGVPFVRAPNRTGEKAAIMATIGPMVDGGVVLSGHTDVVPVEGQAWTGDPFRVRRADGRLYGRGACDMKGFDAVCLAMVPEFQAADLARPIHILLSYDEETTCAGSLDLIRRFGADLPRPALTLVGEPTSMEVADAHKSVSTYRTRVRGRESHSAKIHQGVSAVHVAAELIGELERIGAEIAAQSATSDRFDPPVSTVHVGVISGGTARNIMARDCEFLWEFRGLPGVSLRTAYNKFMLACDEVAARRFAAFPDCEIVTEIEVEIPALGPEPGSAAETLALRLAQANHTVAVPYASEAGQFQLHNVPTVLCGPGSIEQAHQADEYVEIAQIEECLAFMRRLKDELTR
ncbi:MAG: acetylornithine deacetylase [Methylobacteriaceae bacterium]|nr:acetylornithine deacetylase [Methylobacteriaceae bacterium]